MTVRDLLTHRSGLGLGEGDLMFWPASDFTRPEVVDRLKYLKPATSFRSSYAYDNVLYIAAGRWAAGTPDEVLTSEGLSELYGTDVDVVRVRNPIVIVGAPDEATGPHHGGHG